MKRSLFFITLFLSFSASAQAQWVVTDLDASPANRGAYNAIAIDSGGGIHVSYTSSGLLSRRIRYILRDATGIWSDSILLTPFEQSAVWPHSITVAPNNEVFIGYYDSLLDDLHLLRRPLSARPLEDEWTNTLIDEIGDVGRNPSSIFVGNQGSLFISYYSATDNQFKFAALNQERGELSLENIENDPLETALGIEAIGRNSVATFLRVAGAEGLGVIYKYRAPSLDDAEVMTDYLGLALKVQSVEEETAVPPGGFPPWLISPVILPTGDRDPLLISGDLGDRFDIAVINRIPGFHICFYDQESQTVKYAQRLELSSRILSSIIDVASPSADREVLDDCSIAVCGNQVHVIVRKDVTVAPFPDAHVYESYSRNFLEGESWTYREVGRGIGSLHDPNWTVSSACGRDGGLHVVFPVRTAVSGVDLKHAYLAPPAPTCGDWICSGGEVLASCPLDCAVCGDGICTSESGATEGVTCREDCPLPECGNGVVETDEECDDDNFTDGDGCTRECRTETGGPACGDRVEDVGETCDDGDRESGDGCDENCQLELAVIFPAPPVVGPPAVIDDGVVDVGGPMPQGVGEIEAGGGEVVPAGGGGGCSLILPRR